MEEKDPVDLLTSWDFAHNGIPPNESTLPARLELQALRLLAEGQPVSAERLASKLNLPVTLVNAIFNQKRTMAGEWNDEGHLVGSALTLVPTPHSFRVKSQDLYAWCAFDTLLLPGLLGETAQIKSPDPISGELILLTITPSGVTERVPDTALISIDLSGSQITGPQSIGCQRMHFFYSQKTAGQWQKKQESTTLMTLDEAFQLVREKVYEPMKTALDEMDQTI